MSVIVGLTEPFVFHRAFDVVTIIIEISVALVVFVLYQSKSHFGVASRRSVGAVHASTLLDSSPQWIRALSTACSLFSQ